MKTVPTAVASLILFVALSALPTASAAHASMNISCGDHVRWAEHHDLDEARIAIDTEDGKVTLLLTDRVVAFQLSERTLHKVDRELHDQEDQDHPLAKAITAAVIGTVRELIDTSLECPVRELKDVSYRDGRLIFTARDGETVFEDTEICDSDITEAFSERDAREFVREFRRLKARGR